MPIFWNSSLTAKCFTPFHCTCCHIYWIETCSSPAIASFSMPSSFLDAIVTPFGSLPDAFRTPRCCLPVDRLLAGSPLLNPNATSVSAYCMCYQTIPHNAGACQLGWACKKGRALPLCPEPVSYTHLRAHETRHDLV